MNPKAKLARPVLAASGLAMALFAASPAIKATGTLGLALAADTPPAVAQPAGAANKSTASDSTSAVAAPVEDLSYHRANYVYTSADTRDPFGSLIKGNFVSDGTTQLPDIGSVELLGVVWGE